PSPAAPHVALGTRAQFSCKRRSTPGPARRPSACRAGLPIAIEHIRQKFRFDALSRVTDGDLDVGVYAFQTDLDAAALVRELDGVREQVPNHLLQTIRVAGDLPDVAVEAAVGRDALCFPPPAPSLLRLPDPIRHIYRAHFQLQLAADDARGV